MSVSGLREKEKQSNGWSRMAPSRLANMGMHMNRHSNKTREHTTCEEVCQAFQRDLTSLYQLALLLTGDHEMAESILVTGIDECVDGNLAFKGWARSWARRIIIEKAIRLIAPLPGPSDYRHVEDIEGEVSFGPDGLRLAVAGLSPFDRFVFVMSVLERIPDRECAALLGCGTPAIVNARIRALQTIARAMLPRHEAEGRNPALAGLEVA
jgi:DNA-directed RNA polymerase specialized sigma24 family protein